MLLQVLHTSVSAVWCQAVTYMLVVDDHPLLTGGLVGTGMLVNAPVTAPSAQNATTATASRYDRMYTLETVNNYLCKRTWRETVSQGRNVERGLIIVL